MVKVGTESRRTIRLHGLLDMAITRCGGLQSDTRAEPCQSPGAGAAAALQFRRDYSMMYNLVLAALPALGTVTLAIVYLMSKDPDRRGRAWRLLKLFLRQ